MKTLLTTFFVFVVLFSHGMYAETADKTSSLISGEFLAIVLSAVVTILGSVFGMTLKRISRTFKEAGEFMSTLGSALEDNRLTRDELTAIIKEGSDIFTTWK